MTGIQGASTKRVIITVHFYIRNPDLFVASLPVKIPLLLNEGLEKWREEGILSPKKCIGYFFNIPCRLLVVITGLPLIIYATAKTILFKILVSSTCYSIKPLRNYSKELILFNRKLCTHVFKSIFGQSLDKEKVQRNIKILEMENHKTHIAKYGLRTFKLADVAKKTSMTQSANLLLRNITPLTSQLPNDLFHIVFEFIELNQLVTCAKVSKSWNKSISSYPLVKYIDFIQKILQGKEISESEMIKYPTAKLNCRINLGLIYEKIDPEYIVLKNLLTGDKISNLLKNDVVDYFFTENVTLLAKAVKKDPNILKLITAGELKENVKSICDFENHINKTSKDDKEIVLATIHLNQFAAVLKYASENLRNDKDIALAIIVNQDAYGFEHISTKLRSDKNIVLAAVNRNGAVLRYASENLKNDRDIVLAAISHSASSLQYASENLRNDKDIVLFAVRQHGFALRYASESLKNDKDIVLTAIKQYRFALQYASIEIRNNKRVVLAAIHKNGFTLQYASKQLRDDANTVLAAINQNAFSLQYASVELKNNREIILATVNQDAFALQYASENLKGDRSIALATVHKQGLALQYISLELRNDKEIILAAVNQTGLALQYASTELRNNKDVVLAAVRNCWRAAQYASDELQKDTEVLTAVALNKANFG